MQEDNSIQIKSARLTIRPIQIADADAIFEYRSNAEVNLYQGWIPKSIDDVHDFIANKVAPEINLPCKWFQLVIIKDQGNELIGDIGVYFPATDASQVEMGCTLNQTHHGKGYATEALKATITYLFEVLGKRRIVASVDPRNLPSIRLIERLGFLKKGHKMGSLFINGEWVDDFVYALERDECEISPKP